MNTFISITKTDWDDGGTVTVLWIQKESYIFINEVEQQIYRILKKENMGLDVNAYWRLKTFNFLDSNEPNSILIASNARFILDKPAGRVLLLNRVQI